MDAHLEVGSLTAAILSALPNRKVESLLFISTKSSAITIWTTFHVTGLCQETS